MTYSAQFPVTKKPKTPPGLYNLYYHVGSTQQLVVEAKPWKYCVKVVVNLKKGNNHRLGKFKYKKAI